MTLKKSPIMQTLGELGRRLSTQTVMFHQAIADRLGINLTDYKAMDIIERSADGVTPGEIAAATGLTSGAVTGVLDRLERAGFIERVKHPDDRRQILVRVVPQRVAEVYAVIAPMVDRFGELVKRYSPEQLDAIIDYMERSVELMGSETARVRGLGEAALAAEGSTGTSAPLGDLERAELELDNGARQLSLTRGEPEWLYSASFEGTPPELDLNGGRLRVRFGGGWFKRGARALSLALNDTIPWSIHVKHGLWQGVFDLDGLLIDQLAINGGVADTRIALPAPAERVEISINGGAHNLSLSRPKGVAIRTRISGGGSDLHIDSLRLGSSGSLDWESPDWASAQSGYEIRIHGGASHLSVHETRD